MKKSGSLSIMLAFIATTLAVAQEQPAAKPATPEIARTNLVARVDAPTENDMYCSGFISAQPVPQNSFLAAGWDSPHQTRFAGHDFIYLTGGTYEKGAKFQIIRPIKDIMIYESYKGQRKNVNAAGHAYAELGRVHIIEVQKGIGIAEVEFSCDGFTLGDLVIPWAERPAPQFRRQVPFNQFAEPNGKLTGRIVAMKEFDTLAAAKSKVYLNVGSNSGVKPGDYFRATRTYASLNADAADGMSLKASEIEPMLNHPPKFPKKKDSELPRKSLGEMIVLYATPTTATAMVVRSLEQIQVGDGVELMEELPPLPPPPPPPAPIAPTVTCSAMPATIRVGETANIHCTGTSEDQHPITFSFTTDNGAIGAHGENAALDARNAHPGIATITTTVTDDRNLSASTTTTVNVEQATAIEASRAGDINFKPNNAYVDNTAKAILDGIALRLQGEVGSSVMIVGFVAEKEAARLALTRASNAKTYLTRDKGIDPGRIQTADGGAGAHKAEIWFVPAGAAMPTITPAAPAPKPPVKPAVKPAAKPAAKPATKKSGK